MRKGVLSLEKGKGMREGCHAWGQVEDYKEKMWGLKDSWRSHIRALSRAALGKIPIKEERFIVFSTGERKEGDRKSDIG